jgi:hypothetical protein
VVIAATNKVQPNTTISAQTISSSKTLLTGCCDACIGVVVIDWHAIIAETRSQCDVVDETALTIVDLESDESRV